MGGARKEGVAWQGANSFARLQFGRVIIADIILWHLENSLQSQTKGVLLESPEALIGAVVGQAERGRVEVEGNRSATDLGCGCVLEIVWREFARVENHRIVGGNREGKQSATLVTVPPRDLRHQQRSGALGRLSVGGRRVVGHAHEAVLALESRDSEPEGVPQTAAHAAQSHARQEETHDEQHDSARGPALHWIHDDVHHRVDGDQTEEGNDQCDEAVRQPVAREEIEQRTVHSI